MRFPQLAWPSLRALLRRLPPQTEDRVALSLPGLDLRVERVGRLTVPAELTVVIPRAELRARLQTPGGEQASVEIILNSITVVHSPRHPAEKAAPSTPPPALSRGSRTAGT